LWQHNFYEVAIFIGPNAFGIRIVSTREPIRLPACLCLCRCLFSCYVCYRLSAWNKADGDDTKYPTISFHFAWFCRCTVHVDLFSRCNVLYVYT